MIVMENNVAIPIGYRSRLGIRETEIAIKLIKDQFEMQLADTLNLLRVSAPLFLRPETGLNDNLSGVERPVSFDVRDLSAQVEIVQSLAKWKRYALAHYGLSPDEGLYTDMNAIRRDEVLDNLHSIYVDQWDWEKIITKEERCRQTLHTIVLDIYRCFCRMENHLLRHYPCLDRKLPPDLFFITSQELEDRYPHLVPQAREHAICKEYKAVFVEQIGDKLRSGQPHDVRAPDYDDWQLNGDLIFWYPTLERAVEVSSMGIRVDAEAMRRQLALSGCLDRAELDFHRMVLTDQLPLTIGGGIGQSRICMYFLDKAHIGEVQASVWPERMIQDCKAYGINLL
ncbi:MAG: aspartate--ammonia ligase [Clostridia bacterium]|nr:aspartate--ammonia ligase [Clostridia bacterium]